LDGKEGVDGSSPHVVRRRTDLLGNETVIVALHVATGAAVGASSGSRLAAILAGPILHLSPEATVRRPPPDPLSSARLLRLLDPSDSCFRCNNARVAVVPTDAQARRFLDDDLFDDAPPRRLRDTLGLENDSVSRMRFHCATS
jgi:hypothetical protein